jgi:hypothetical protein
VSGCGLLTDRISGATHPYPTAEWVSYSHGAMLADVRKVHREAGNGGLLLGANGINGLTS